MSLLIKLLHWGRLAWWWVFRPVSLGVRVLLVQDQRVLLVTTTYEDESAWFLPGGGVKRRETLEEAARREAGEEVGAELGDLRFQGVFTGYHQHKSDHVVVFACEEFALSGRSDREIRGLAFFPLDDLPATTQAGHRRRIEEYRQDPARAPRVDMW